MRAKKIDSLSIHIGTQCNLRCDWCYDQCNSPIRLDFVRFKPFYDSVIKNNIHSIILIGGEPLMHQQIEDYLSLLKDQYVYIVTNGICLSNPRILSVIKNYTNIVFSISLKGFDDQSMYKTTKTHSFEKLEKALTNLTLNEITADYSYVYDSNAIDSKYDAFLSFCNDHSIKRLTVSDVRPYLNENGTIIGKTFNEEGFQAFVMYLLGKEVDVSVKIQNPYCRYSGSFIDELKRRNKLISSCSIKKGGSLYLNSNLDLILCDSCYDILLGRYIKDYSNYQELIDYFYSPEVRAIYNRLKGCPQWKCVHCEEWRNCGGGCLLNWR